MREFIFGAFVYRYQLIPQDRKTLSLTVTPDLDIILKCPPKTDNERIEKFLQKKWFWLEKQLSFFKKYQRKLYKKEYISGEGFFYLGRQYKLTIKKSTEDRVSLTKGKLIVNTKKDNIDVRYNKKLINAWFLSRSEKIFQERFEEMLKKFNYQDDLSFSIREMKRRWGSILKQKKVLLNSKLIHTSKECIDYVIVHELCHVKHKKHDKRFYDLLKKKYPKWEKVKEKLELLGAMISF
jgi:predicted metal-dependent hydrolase